MKNSFFKFMLLAESNVSSEIKLSDNSDLKPFIIDENNNSNLRILLKAFLNSDKVNIYGPFGDKLTSIDKNKGEITHKLKKKNLYLTGGAVRDFFQNRTPRDYDLTTDATPNEIRLILNDAGFSEVKPNNENSKYSKLSDKGIKRKTFNVLKWDKNGKEYVFNISINGQDFELATFRKNPKNEEGNPPDKIQFSSLEDDAQKRDFTINSLYIPLSNIDGPNSKLIDPHGGIHHLLNNKVNFIGNPKDRLSEDPSRALRYLRFAAMLDNNEIPTEIQDVFSDFYELPNVKKDFLKNEFLNGLLHPNINPKKYLKLYKNSGFLNSIFPNLELFNDFSDSKDKRLAIALLLKQNPLNKIDYVLNNLNFDKKDIMEILFLIELLNTENNNLKYKMDTQTSFVPSLIRKWGKLNNKSFEKFLNPTNENFEKHNTLSPDEILNPFNGV